MSEHVVIRVVGSELPERGVLRVVLSGQDGEYARALCICTPMRTHVRYARMLHPHPRTPPKFNTPDPKPEN
jgi:hypothetical protein